jgi:hypothetical protein
MWPILLPRDNYYSGAKIVTVSTLSKEMLESIASWAEWLSAIFGILAAIFVVILVLVNRPLKRMADKEAQDAQLKLSEQQERTAAAEARVTSLEKDTANAKSAQQRVQTDLEAQKELTAKAQKDASDAALALAKFKAPRSLSPEQQESLVSVLYPFAGQNFALAVFPDPEPLALTRLLNKLLKSAGWTRVPAQIQRNGGVLMDVDGETVAQISDSGIDAYCARRYRIGGRAACILFGISEFWNFM